MLIAFELTMPNRGSWNGRWSGEDRRWIVVRNMGRGKRAEETAKPILEKGHWHYSWSDGWGASIVAREVDGQQAAKLRRMSAGFCGYDWMVSSIIKHNKIVA